MPSLITLRGEPPDGYESVLAFAYSERAVSWFVKQDAEFTPPLLIVGMFYDIVAVTPVHARSQAIERFAIDLRQERLPLPIDSVQAEIAA